MPEGDTVKRAAAKLHRALAGRPIERLEIRWGSRPTPDVAGRTTLEVVAAGKHILHRIDGGLTVHSHLRMEGAWRVVARERMSPRATANPQLRALVLTAGHAALGLRLGMLDVLRTSDEPRLIGHLGPDILGAGWDLEAAVANVAADERPIGEVLLDQRRLAGIGTMYAAESLFIERIAPWQPASELPSEVVRSVIERARRLMVANLDFDVQSTTGSRARGQEKFVHARSGRPCRRCGQTVRVAMIGQAPSDRTMFYCPACQGGLGPTDDGRPQAPLGHDRRGR